MSRPDDLVIETVQDRTASVDDVAAAIELALEANLPAWAGYMTERAKLLDCLNDRDVLEAFVRRARIAFGILRVEAGNRR